jgi:Na+/melibiose symporter-like transporter
MGQQLHNYTVTLKMSSFYRTFHSVEQVKSWGGAKSREYGVRSNIEMHLLAKNCFHLSNVITNIGCSILCAKLVDELGKHKMHNLTLFWNFISSSFFFFTLLAKICSHPYASIAGTCYRTD